MTATSPSPGLFILIKVVILRSRTFSCDKNMPGCVIAAARHNRPTVIVYGGTIQAGVRKVDCPSLGHKKGDDMNIADAFESYGAFAVGKITEEQRLDVVRHSCPGPGACGGMFTYAPQIHLQNGPAE